MLHGPCKGILRSMYYAVLLLILFVGVQASVTLSGNVTALLTTIDGPFQTKAERALRLPKDVSDQVLIRTLKRLFFVAVHS